MKALNILKPYRVACAALSLTALACPCVGEVVTEWWGLGDDCAHRSMTVRARADGSTEVRFDLSAIPRGAKVFRASLRALPPASIDLGPKPGQTLHAASGVGSGATSPAAPVEIYTLDAGGKRLGKPLRLEPPRYASFAATAAVAKAVGGPTRTLALLVKPCEVLSPREFVLEITHAGRAGKVPPPVTGLKVFHRAGQTFITWTEIDKLITSERVARAEFNPICKQGSPRGTVLYRVYRGDRPITAETIALAERVDEVGPLSGYDERIRQNRTRGEIFQGRDPKVIVPRYCIGATPPLAPLAPNTENSDKRIKGEWTARQLPLHTGLYVTHPPRAGKAYYAVVPCVNGVENTRDFSAANSLAEPVAETVGPGEPVLYRRVDLGHSHRNKVMHETQFFAYWANPPHSSLPQEVIHYLVGVDSPGSPEPRSMNVRVGIADMYWSELVRGTHSRQWKDHPHVDVALVADRSLAAIGYHSTYGTLKAYSEGQVEPYTIRLLGLILPHVQKRWRVNPGRVSCAGTFLGLHLPDIFTYTSAGGHQTVMNLKWSPIGRSLLNRWGPPDVSRAAYDRVDVSAIVRADPARETPFLRCPGGKGSGHKAEIGWEQNPKAYRALMDTKRPFVASWEASIAVDKHIREMTHWDHNVPAFGRCSLDDNPGSGDRMSGDLYGQINGYLWWDHDSGTDEAGRWALTVFLVDSCPAERCTVDVTPRRLKKFKPKPGDRFTWTSRAGKGGEVTGRGRVVADEHGLVTVKQVTVTKGATYLAVTASR